MPEYKLKIITDALIALETDATLNAAIVDDELASVAEDLGDRFDESGDDIAADLVGIQTSLRKARRTTSRKKYAQTERGKAIIAAAKKIWRQSDAGKAAARRYRQSDAARAAKKAWKKSTDGKASKKIRPRPGRLAISAILPGDVQRLWTVTSTG